MKSTCQHFAVCNGAEGEPATFKDRALLRANPYQVIEGLVIAGQAVDAREGFVAVKASFGAERRALERALTEMGDAGLLVDMPVSVVTGPEEYLFGEEKALLEVIEGNDPLPRWMPPLPAWFVCHRSRTGLAGPRSRSRPPRRGGGQPDSRR